MGNLTAKTSGELASFMTPAKTNIKSLKVHFSPKQLGTGDPSPENVREIEGWDGVNAYNDPKYGGFVVWNQLYDGSGSTGTNGGITYTKLDNGTWEIKGTSDTTSGTAARRKQIKSPSWEANHVYWFSARAVGEGTQYLQMVLSNSGSIKTTTTLYDGTFAKPTEKINQFSFRVLTKNVTVDVIARPQIIDLTMLFGEEMANYIYKSKSGAGKDYFFNLFPKDWYEYNVGELTTVSAVNNEPYTNLLYQWKKLPNEYQEVEYIESDGGQYINTNIFTSKSINTEYNAVIGYWNYSSGRQLFGADYGAYFGINNGYYEIGKDSISSIAASTDKYDVIKFFQDIDAQKQIMIINNTGTIVREKYDTFRSNKIYLFSIGASSSYKAKCRIKSFVIKQNQSVIADFIPCYRKSDDEIGMYDIVSQNFFTNNGTGTFVKGEDVFCDTIYGGYIDLISGELVEEYSYLDLSNLNWDVTSQVGVFRSDDLTNYYVSSITNFICNKYITTSHASTSIASMQDLNIKAHDVNDKYIYIKDTGYTDVTEFKSSLIDCNMVYLLATPITHQLTPTQLQSFVGQNNFWSNADYVEVEYDLIETIDIQKARQKIILNQPQLKTISDKVVSFNTDMVAPMKNCKIYFKPIQEGSGDPSPTNVRNINGWTGLDSYVNRDKISVDWASDAGTVYGGYVDLAKGELVIDWVYFLFSRSSKVSDYGTTADGLRKWMTLRITHNVPPYQITPNNGDDYGLFSIGDWRHGVVTGRNRAYVNSTYVYAVITTDIEDLTTAEGRTAYFNRLETNNIPIEVVYKRATPLRYQLTPQQLLTLKGINNIWSNTNGQTEVKFWTH